jgi:hypothetical protein
MHSEFLVYLYICDIPLLGSINLYWSDTYERSSVSIFILSDPFCSFALSYYAYLLPCMCLRIIAYHVSQDIFVIHHRVICYCVLKLISMYQVGLFAFVSLSEYISEVPGPTMYDQ